MIVTCIVKTTSGVLHSAAFHQPISLLFLPADAKLTHNFNRATKEVSSWGIEPKKSQMEKLNKSVLQIKGMLLIILTNVF